MMPTSSPRRIVLPLFNTVLTMTPNGSGTIASALNDDPLTRPLTEFVLACACAGVDVESPAFLEAFETAVGAVGNEIDKASEQDPAASETQTGLQAFTVFCVSSEIHTTTHISCHRAGDKREAVEMAKAETADDWGEPIENICVRGVAEGDITILDWTDDWECTPED